MKALLRCIAWLNRHCKSLAVRLNGGVHPKHGLAADGWYMPWIKPGMWVLDAGAGIGIHADRLFLERDCTVYAVDKVPGPLMTAMDLEYPLPLGASMFDAVLLLDVLEHIENRAQLLAEIQRILRPGGLLLLSAPNVLTSWKRRLMTYGLPYMADPDHKTEYTWRAIATELAGWQIERVDPIVVDTPWAGVIALVGAVSFPLYARIVGRLAHKAIALPNETTGWRIVCRKVA